VEGKRTEDGKRKIVSVCCATIVTSLRFILGIYPAVTSTVKALPCPKFPTLGLASTLFPTTDGATVECAD